MSTDFDPSRSERRRVVHSHGLEMGAVAESFLAERRTEILAKLLGLHAPAWFTLRGRLQRDDDVSATRPLPDTGRLGLDAIRLDAIEPWLEPGMRLVPKTSLVSTPVEPRRNLDGELATVEETMRR